MINNKFCQYNSNKLNLIKNKRVRFIGTIFFDYAYFINIININCY